MTTLVTLITFFGFFLLYNTSGRALLFRTFKIEVWIQADRKRSRRTGFALLLAAAILGVWYYGWGAGLFAFFVILMTVGSLVVVLAPLRYLNYKTLLLVLAVALTLEFL